MAKKLGQRKTSGGKKTNLANRSIFGERQTITGGTLTLPLAQLLPDFNQARQILPPPLRASLTAGKLTPAEVMTLWIAENKQTPSPQFEKVISLARSIQTQGLINPITVIDRYRDQYPGLFPDVTHIIVTGERRFWAHTYLAISGTPDHNGRPVTTINTLPLADNTVIEIVQYAENAERDDYSALENALAVQKVRDGLSRLAGENVTWETVQKELGITRQHRTRLTNILQLSNSAQTLIQAHNLKETAIRPVVAQLRGNEALQITALTHLIEKRPTSADFDQYVKALLQEVEPSQTGQDPTNQPTSASTWSKPLTTIDKSLTRLKKSYATLSPTDRATAAADLRRLRDEIDQLLGSQ